MIMIMSSCSDHDHEHCQGVQSLSLVLSPLLCSDMLAASMHVPRVVHPPLLGGLRRWRWCARVDHRATPLQQCGLSTGTSTDLFSVFMHVPTANLFAAG